MRLTHAAGSSGDSVGRSLSGGCGRRLGNTGGAVPSLSLIPIRLLTEHCLPVVTVRLASNTSRSVSSLSRSGRGDGENDSSNLHLDTLLYGSFVATVVFGAVQRETL